MSEDLKQNEKALIKQINYFKKKADRLIADGKLGDEHRQMITSCETLVHSLNAHAAKREEILRQRESLKSIIRENAECPKCHTSSNLKLAGIERTEEGWICNKYRCRKCNIEFVQSRPNNPWDMVPYIEKFISQLETRIGIEQDETFRMQGAATIQQMRETLEKLRPVIEASDQDFAELKERDAEMEKLTNEFKTALLIERIKMDAVK